MLEAPYIQKIFPFGYSITAEVERVIDGDTFILAGSPAGLEDSQRVKMLGIDTPELARNNKPAEPFSDEAYLFTKSLIEGKTIQLTFDGEAYDIFGRLLAYVWLIDTDEKTTLLIQAELLKKGYARIAYYNKQKRYYHVFYNLRRSAMQNNLGIWNRNTE